MMKENPQLRFLLESPEDSAELGRMLAEALAGPSAVPNAAPNTMSGAAPLRAIYFFGSLGSGKTTLIRELVSHLPGGEQAEAASPSFTLCNEYPTNPPVLHADLYRLGEGAGLPEEMEAGLEEGALLLLEWAEYLDKSEYAPERLEIFLGRITGDSLENLDISPVSCERKRLAGVTGYGEAGKTLLQRLQPHLESRFRPVGPESTLSVSKERE